jgi:hypothetical protein
LLAANWANIPRSIEDEKDEADMVVVVCRVRKGVHVCRERTKSKKEKGETRQTLVNWDKGKIPVKS